MKRTAFTKKRPIIPILRTYSSVEAPNLLTADQVKVVEWLSG